MPDDQHASCPYAPDADTGTAPGAAPPEDLPAGPGLDFVTDPHPWLAELRARGPVHRVRLPTGDPVWLVVGHDEVRSALTDPRLRNDIRHSAGWESDGGHAIGRNMLQVDPPDHTRLRALVAREFTAHRVRALRPRIEEISHALLDAALPAGRADLVPAFALPLPVTVICELLGVPEPDRAAFRSWSADMVKATDPEAGASSAAAMTTYLTGLIAAKRALGEPADGRPEDLLTALARTGAGREGTGPREPAAGAGAARDADRPIDGEELLGMAFLLLVAGHETTANLISSAVDLLLRHPDQLAALRADRSLLPGAVEEALRFEPPTLATAYRHAAEPLTLGGARMAAGDSVIVQLASAARDARHFTDPDRFDIRRDPAETRAHVSFGYGVHHCLGAPLARLEATVALGALLDRAPGLALEDPTAAADWRPGLLRGLRSLPVRF